MESNAIARFAAACCCALISSFSSLAPAADETPTATPPPTAVAVGRFDVVRPGHAATLIERERAHVLDTRPFAKYANGHVPGAVHLDDESLRASAAGLPARFLDVADLRRAFERAGVAIDRPVIVYADDEDPLSAAMTAYALLMAGHPRVHLLDGGFDAWRGNHPVTQEHRAWTSTTWGTRDAAAVSAKLADVRRMSDTSEGDLVDARPARLFRGEDRSWIRNGHIPGAINLDWRSLVRTDNEASFKPRAEIERLLKEAGLDARNPTVVYCGTGREATLLFMYLKGVLEWPRVRLYEGSWTEWSARPELHVATGDESDATFIADGEVSIGGQPTAAQLAEMAADGVTTIINCRTSAETASLGFSEAAAAKRLGLEYVEIPLGGNEGFEPDDLAALAAAMEQHKGGKVVLHCASGGRALQLWMAHLVNAKGMKLEDVQARMRSLGLIRDSAFERLTGSRTRSTVEP